MSLSEVYFYMIIILYQILSVIIVTNTEDLKERKHYNKYLKITLILGLTGIIMELFGWNYLCSFNCILFTFIPFITLNISKLTIIIFRKVFTKEPFQLHRGELSDGIWVKNKGNLADKTYYSLFSTTIMISPIFAITILYILIKENMC